MKMTTFASTDDLITSFDLNQNFKPRTPGSKTIYHFVYGSQLYGTLFGIFGRFEGIVEPDKITLKSLTLRMLNYQGVINLGFTTDVPVFRELPAEPDNRYQGEIYFGVRGTSTDNEIIMPFESDKVILKGQTYRLTFNRILFPIVGEAPEPSTEVDYYARPSQVPILNTRYFDSEFFGRSGLDHFNNPLRRGMAHATGKNKGLNALETIPTARCSQSVVNLFY